MSFDPTRRLMISRHASLKSRAGGEVLVLPERALRVGGSGGEILRLCESRSGEGLTGESIVEAMRARYPDTRGVDAEVLAFLSEMFQLGAIVPIPDNDGKKP